MKTQAYITLSFFVDGRVKLTKLPLVIPDGAILSNLALVVDGMAIASIPFGYSDADEEDEVRAP